MSAALLLGWLCAVGAAALLLLTRRAARRDAERVVRACHELRGPLTNVMLALGEGDAPGRGDLAGALTLELSRARRAVEDLGAAAAGRAGQDEVRGVAVAPLVRDLAAVHDLAARARGRRVLVADPLPDAVVLGDRARLAQAIGNLVQNALEHGAGTVRIGVGTRDGAVAVEVADEGHGLRVPIDALVRGRRRGQRGRGMGIVADSLAAHGGRLRSAPSAGGARLVAELPVVPSARAVAR